MGTNRVVIGQNDAGTYGLFVAQKGDNANNPSGNLAFDSRASANFNVVGYGQGTLSAHTNTSTIGSTLYNKSPKTFYTSNTSSGSVARVAHNVSGYTPTVIARFIYADYINSGKALKVFTPAVHLSHLQVQFVSFSDGTPDDPKINNSIAHGFDYEIDGTYMYFMSYEGGFNAYNTLRQSRTIYSGRTVYYSYLIFDQPDIGVKL